MPDGAEVYQEDVQAVRVITLKSKMMDGLKEWLQGDPMAALAGETSDAQDLLAQPMLWRKTGKGRDTVETITGTKDALSDAAVAAAQTLTDESLADAVRKCFGQQRLGTQKAPTVAGGSGGGVAAQVAEDDTELVNVADVEDTSATVVDFNV